MVKSKKEKLGRRLLTFLSKGRRDSVPFSMKPFTNEAEPTPDDLELFESLYRSVPELFQGINTMADNAILAGYEIYYDDEGRKTEMRETLDNLDFTAILINVAKQLLIFGNAYIEVSYVGPEITALDFIHPSTMELVRNKQGVIEKYVQTDSFGVKHELSPDEIIHFSWNKIADNPYGIGLVEPLKKTITYKLNTELAIATSADNYANPVQMWYFGTVDRPWTKVKIQAFLDDFSPSKSIGVSGDVRFELKAPKDQLRLDYYLEHNNRQMLAGIQVPDCLLGWGQGTTEAVARVELQGFDRRVQSLRLDIKRPIDTQLFPLIAKLKGWDSSPLLLWPLTTSQESDVAEEMVKLVGAGIISTDYARMRLGMEDGAVISDGGEEEGGSTEPEPKEEPIPDDKETDGGSSSDKREEGS